MQPLYQVLTVLSANPSRRVIGITPMALKVLANQVYRVARERRRNVLISFTKDPDESASGINVQRYNAWSASN